MRATVTAVRSGLGLGAQAFSVTGRFAGRFGTTRSGLVERMRMCRLLKTKVPKGGTVKERWMEKGGRVTGGCVTDRSIFSGNVVVAERGCCEVGRMKKKSD